MNDTSDTHMNNDKPAQPRKPGDDAERRHLVIFGYEAKEMERLMKHFKAQLPDFIRLRVRTENLVTFITLSGSDTTGIEMLRFHLNRLQAALAGIFSEELIGKRNQSLAEILGEELKEKDLTVASAESCTGGNIANKIVLVPGSSAYFMGSVVSYSNDVKADVLGVDRGQIETHGAVSRQVAEEMAAGVARLMRTECSIATTGVAGPDGGTRYKPVGTVWIAARCMGKTVSECHHFEGDRRQVIESATNTGIVMLIRLLRNDYVMQEEYNDE